MNGKKVAKQKASKKKKGKTVASTPKNSIVDFESNNETVALTLRIPLEVNKALDLYVQRHTSKQRQKKKVILAILTRFLSEEAKKEDK